MDAQPTVPTGASPNPQEARPELEGVTPTLERASAAPIERASAPGATPSSAPVNNVQPVVDPMALVNGQPTLPSPTPGPVAATPAPNLAADVDVIEQEWVDKAQEAIAKHVGDPYGEEEAVEELQESYLQQRYGLNVHEPGEDTTNTDSA